MRWCRPVENMPTQNIIAFAIRLSNDGMRLRLQKTNAENNDANGFECLHLQKLVLSGEIQIKAASTCPQIIL